jgi:hypothetical protein
MKKVVNFGVFSFRISAARGLREGRPRHRTVLDGEGRQHRRERHLLLPQVQQ